MSLKITKIPTAKFIDLKICSKIEVYDYLGSFFKKPRFFRLPNSLFLEKIILFIFKYVRKIILFFQLILRLKITFSNPKKFKNILFDNVDYNSTKVIFEKKNYFVLKCRIEQIDKIFISKEIIHYIFKNLFKHTLKENYLSAIIILVKPKNVLTSIENSIDFFIQARIFKNKPIEFIAVQNASTFDTDKKIKESRYFSRYFSFSDYEKKIFNNKSLNKKIIPMGSIRALAAKKYLTKSHKIKKIYDICLISEPCFEPYMTDLIENNIDKKINLVAKHCLTFSKKFKKKLIVCGKFDHKSSDIFLEKKFYEHNLKSNNLKIRFNNKLKFGSYKNILESEIVIGSTSTMLREAFAFKKKVLWCNYLGASLFPFEKPIKLKKIDYNSFEKILLKLLNMSNKTYFNKIKNLDYIYYYKQDNFEKLKKHLR